MPAADLDRETADWRTWKAADLRDLGNDARRRSQDRLGPVRRHGRHFEPGQWHEERAASLERGEAPRLAWCGTEPMAAAACHVCGRSHVLERACGSRWCERCGTRTGIKVKRQVRDSLRARMRDAWAEWRHDGAHPFMRPKLHLLTLTGPHSGNVGLDRDRLVRAWHRQLAWMHKRGQKPYAYVARHEITPGRDELGHWHLHVAIIVPWVNFGAFAAQWKRSLDCERAAPPDWGARAKHDRRREYTIDDAASYVAKYVTKPCPSVDARTAGNFYCAAYARRLTHASVAFWLRRKWCCGEPWHVVPFADWSRRDCAVDAARDDAARWLARKRAGPPLAALSVADAARAAANTRSGADLRAH